MTTSEIKIWNRSAAQLQTELVYGEAATTWAYVNPLGRWLTDHVLTHKFFSAMYGSTQDTRFSARKVPSFIQKFQIPIGDYEEPHTYSSFNQFFIRKFKAGKRPIVSDSQIMAAPCEARYLAWNKISADQTFPVKGYGLSAKELLGGHAVANKFVGGPLLLARLCPVDYHRFHYPDSGKTLESYRLHGKYHSVNPVALKVEDRVFIDNERHVSILQTENFGTLAYVEVGALCVGKIVQSHPSAEKIGGSFLRGEEKGYFLFGGSTVIVLGEPGRWQPSQDVITNTTKKLETLIRLGDAIAVRGNS